MQPITKKPWVTGRTEVRNKATKTPIYSSNFGCSLQAALLYRGPCLRKVQAPASVEKTFQVAGTAPDGNLYLSSASPAFARRNGIHRFKKK